MIIARRLAGALVMSLALVVVRVSVSSCANLQITIPAAGPDKHPRPATAPAEDLGMAYFRYAGHWHQMRLQLSPGWTHVRLTSGP